MHDVSGREGKCTGIYSTSSARPQIMLVGNGHPLAVMMERVVDFHQRMIGE